MSNFTTITVSEELHHELKEAIFTCYGKRNKGIIRLETEAAIKARIAVLKGEQK